MSFEIDWEHLPSTQKKTQKGGESKEFRPLNFINFGKDTTHIVRPIGKARGCWRFWCAAKRKYVYAKVILDNKGNIVESNVDELKEILGTEPQQRFAINVIDRSDNEIKILEAPATLLADFGSVTKATGHNPGSAQGGNWKIDSAGDGKKRRYSCNYLGPVPFTDAEKLRIKNPDPLKNEWYLLEEIFKPTPIERVLEWMGESKTTSTEETSDVSEESAGTVVLSDDEELDF